MKPPSPRKDPPHVALIVETSMVYGRVILRGISPYIRENGPWTVYLEHRSLQDPEPPWLRNWDGDGIISGTVPPVSSVIHAHGIPTVDLNDQGDLEDAERRPTPGRGRSHIESDHKAIGALA